MATRSISFTPPPARTHAADSLARPAALAESARVGVRLRLRRWQRFVARAGARALHLDRTVYVDQRAAEYRRYWEEAATWLGGTLTPLSSWIWEVRVRGVSTRIAGHMVALDDPVTMQVAGDKPLCLRYAQLAGVPTPPHLVFRLSELARAQAFARAAPGPCVVKPAGGTGSAVGITTNVCTAREVENAAVLASLVGEQLLIEHMVPGESYRLHFLDGRLLHAVRRAGLRVAGDGRASAAELARRAGVLKDPGLPRLLAAQRLGPASVPAPGQPVLLRALPRGVSRTRELRTVYDEVATSLICADTVRALGAVMKALGTRFAGIDMVTCDPRLPLVQTGGAFLELNTTPGIHHHYLPGDSAPEPVAVPVLRALLRIQGRAADAGGSTT